jgi:hypothetical protein
MNGLKTRLSAASVNPGSQREEDPIPGSFPKRIERLIPALFAACLAAGCASVPSQKLAPPRKAVRIEDTGYFAGREWFWGVYVMEKRVGYSYLRIERAPSMDDVLKVTSKFKLDDPSKLEETRIDYTKLDFTLLRSEYVRIGEGDALRVIAVVRPDRLEIQTTKRERSTWKTKELSHTVYPSSLINLLPIVRGLWIGNSYRYPVFMASTASIATARQRVREYERLEEFGRPAFKVTTKLKGQSTQSWIDVRGNTLLEKGGAGIFSMSLVLENP